MLLHESQDSQVNHPEVKNRDGQLRSVGAQLYLGYGPLSFQNGGTALKGSAAAIPPDEEATLSFAWPQEQDASLRQVIWLLDQFGAVGGRSRNGWGSLSLMPMQDTPATTGEVTAFGEDWRIALTRDWPHAIGMDGHIPLCWDFQVADWATAMTRLAKIKIALRTQFSFAGHANGGDLRDRHLLSYPVTKHATSAFDRNARLPNSLRFKLAIKDAKLHGRIFHVPCKPAAEVWSNGRERIESGQLQRVWQQVHAAIPEAISSSALPPQASNAPRAPLRR